MVYTGGDDERTEQRTASGTGSEGRSKRIASGSAAGPGSAPPERRRHDQRLREERSASCDPNPGDSPLATSRDPTRYTLADEPLSAGDAVDWRYLYNLIIERIEREEDRGKTLDSKITSLLGGVVAFIGFSFRVNVSVWSAGAALLYIVPLAFLFSAFLIERGESAPTPESLKRSFPPFPISTLMDGIDAMLIVNNKNMAVNALKAARVDLATILTGIVTAIVLITQFSLSWGFRNVPTTGAQTISTQVLPASHRGGPTKSSRHP